MSGDELASSPGRSSSRRTVSTSRSRRRPRSSPCSRVGRLIAPRRPTLVRSWTSTSGSRSKARTRPVLQGPRHDDGDHEGRRSRSEGRRARVDGEHVARRPPRTLRAGLTCGVVIPQGQIAVGKLAQALIHGAGRAGAGQLRRGAGRRPRARSSRRSHGRELDQPLPDRRAEDRVVRDHRRARGRPGRALHPGRQRRQHHRVLAGLPRVRAAGAIGPDPTDAGVAGPGLGTARAGRAGAAPRDDRDRDTASATRRAGTGPSPPATSPAARSAR